MGYNPNKQQVLNCKSILDSMLKYDESFKLHSPAPDKLAYEIRRAIKGIEKFPKSFPDYQVLIGKFTLKEKEDHVLFARRKTLVEGEAILLSAEGLGEVRELCIESVSTPFQVVGAIIKHKAPSYIFPDAATDKESLAKIYKYTSTNNYYIEVINVGLMVTRTKPVNAWQPST